ncbi:MAG: hypothetical protein HRT43_05345 [Campylobacteraceae bacterium]|nr:hypothetical protein [Campylobacteraceae bacterium]
MDSTKHTPNRHLTAVFTFFALLPLVYFIPPWIASYISSNPLIITFLAVLVIVPVVSYIFMPFLHKLEKDFNTKTKNKK